jgi:hypothetical protein
MFYNLKDKLRRAIFSRSVHLILSTKPVDINSNNNIALLTQLQHKDVLLALIALKSFTFRIPVGAIYVLNDGSLTTADIETLSYHIPKVEFLKMEDAYSELCPKGGTWERLLTISRLIKDHYVIQLDSDTLTLSDIPEITECVKENKSFVIGTWDEQVCESMSNRQSQAAALVSKSAQNPHIQLAAESNFNKLARFNELRYVRGCSGFSGFAKGSFDRAFVEEISAQMTQALGDRWQEWGSEQVMSNIVVANTPSNRVLPHPKYCDCSKIRGGVTAFIHFIGSCRFIGGTYAKLSRQVINDLPKMTISE